MGQGCWMVRTDYNTDHDGRVLDLTVEEAPSTFHGPFPTETAAMHFITDVWPDGDTDVHDQVVVFVNDPRTVTG